MRIGFDGWMNCVLIFLISMCVCDNELLFLSFFFQFQNVNRIKFSARLKFVNLILIYLI
jgi:hypothetical protein